MAVMEPGKWYGSSDIARLSGLDPKSVRATLIQKLLAQGLVERVMNPSWRPGVPNPQQIMAGAEVEPMWLYRLVEKKGPRRGGLSLRGN